MKRYILGFLLICFFSFFQTEMKGQCTSDAGIIRVTEMSVKCTSDTFLLPQPEAMVLDSNDIWSYMIYEDKNDPIGSRYFFYSNPEYVAPSRFQELYCSIVVGNPAGQVDFIELNDPCVSISEPITLKILKYPRLSRELGCTSDSVHFTLFGTPPFNIKFNDRNSTDNFELNIFINDFKIKNDKKKYNTRLTSADNCFTSSSSFFDLQRGLKSKPIMSDSILDCSIDFIDVQFEVEGGTPPYTFEFLGGSDSIFYQDTTIRYFDEYANYYSVTDTTGCFSDYTWLHVQKDKICGILTGSIKLDSTNSCTGSSDNIALENWTVTAYSKQDTFWGISDVQGNYLIEVAEKDTFQVELIPPSNKFLICGTSIEVVVDSLGDSDSVDFLAIKNCTSDAGTFTIDSLETCENSIILPIPQNIALDSNDVLWYMVFTDENDPFGSRQSLNRSSLPDSTSISLLGLQNPVYVVALVGDAGSTGWIDLNDPCLSMSNALKIKTGFFRVIPEPYCEGDSAVVFMEGAPPFSGYFLTEPRQSGDTVFINTMESIVRLDPNAVSFEYVLTSGSGCTITGNDITEPRFFDCTFQVSDTLSCLVDEVDIEAICSGGTPPYSYQWSNLPGSTSSPKITVSSPGTYFVNIIDITGCTESATINVFFENNLCGTISGNVLLDAEPDCQITSADTPIDCWLVAAYGKRDTFYGTTDQSGNYSITVLPDTFDVQVVLKNSYYSNCNPPEELIIKNADDALTADFLVKKEINCPLMEIDVSVSRLRRCFDNNTMYVHYCNQGTETAFDASIKIKLDPLMSPTISVLPFTQSGDTLNFQIGDVAPLECRDFSFQFRVSCDAILGQTLCAEARIFPDSLCTSASPMWSMASLNLTAECVDDSIRFTIKNVGTGAMNMDRQYIIIEDAAIMRVSPTFQLPSGETVDDTVFPNGNTIRVEVPQVDNHPGNSMPSVTVEGCGSSNFSIGFVNQLPTDDADPWIDIECAEVRGSYDPNDKAAAPTGFESAHFIDQNVDLEYKIRFQNTGTDTAFKVVILDTLSHLLDIEKLKLGASSHDYRWEVFEDGILKFTFENILLVDSFTNEPASHGFVKYRIAQMPDVALESVIENAADIYFDFNDPIYTNQTFHTVGKDFISVSTQEVFVPGAEVRVYPNPFKSEAQFEILNAPFGKKTLRIFDLSGKLIRTQSFENEQLTLKRNVLPGGIYFYEISGEGAKIAVGKLLVQ